MPEIPFNDRFWQGGQQFLAAIDADYKLALYSGDNAAASIKTSTQPSPVSGLISWATSIDDCATSKLNLGVTDTLSTAMSFDPADAASKGASGRTPLRGRGKNIAFEWTAPAGASWTYAKGVDFIGASRGGPK
jgi:hypothetical protein